MKIRLGKYAGFCSGVNRTLQAVLEQVDSRQQVTTLGPLVHNEAVQGYLTERGVTAAGSLAEVAGGVLVIRTHGVTPAVMEQVRGRDDLTLFDATCPRVRRSQRLAAEIAGRGVQLVIYGDPRHPEVTGLVGWAGGRAAVVSSAAELDRISLREPAALLAQTTGDRAVFAEISNQFSIRVPGGEVYDTLCPETGLRQEEALQLAREADAVVIVGSASSANTAVMVKICRRHKPTCLVAHAGELDPHFFEGCRLIGITAGASTPHWTIKEVVERMEKEGFAVEHESAEQGSTKIDPQVEPEAAEGSPAVESETAAAGEESVAAVEVPAVTDAAESEATAAAEESAEGDAADAAETAGEEPVPVVEVPSVTDAAESEAAADSHEDEAQFAYDTDFKAVQAGEQIVGKVVRAAAEEVFLDIGYKSEAVLPLAEVYLGAGETLPERFAAGDEIEVTVLKVEDQEGNVVVSHKRLAKEKRWQELEQAHRDETVIEGRVKQVVPAGMVIDMGAGIDGFMPGSLVDIRYVPDFKQFLGETVEFAVIEYTREKDKVILSRKKVLEERSTRDREKTIAALEVGSVISGVVRRLTDFGAFVDVGGIDGLVHISELAWERVEHPRDVLKVGDQIEVKVLEVIPEKERISLSLRHVQPDPWTKAMQDLKDGQIVKGKVTRLANFGAFIELKPGVEGLAHISQIADYHVKHPSEVLTEGEEIDVKILEVKPGAKRISLSVKEAGGAVRHADAASGNPADNGNVTLGDVSGGLLARHTTAPEETEGAAGPQSDTVQQAEPEEETEG